MRKIFLIYLVFPIIALLAAPSKNSKTAKSDKIHFANFYNNAPILLEVGDMPHSPMFIILEQDGRIQSLKAKDAIKVESGAWRVEEGKLILHLVIFNAFSCEEEGPCFLYWPAHHEIPLGADTKKISFKSKETKVIKLKWTKK